MAARAVILINNHWVLHIVENDVLKMNVSGKPTAGPSPRLNPHTIHSPCERSCFHRHVFHPSLYCPLPQAPNASIISSQNTQPILYHLATL